MRADTREAVRLPKKKPQPRAVGVGVVVVGGRLGLNPTSLNHNSHIRSLQAIGGCLWRMRLLRFQLRSSSYHQFVDLEHQGRGVVGIEPTSANPLRATKGSNRGEKLGY